MCGVAARGSGNGDLVLVKCYKAFDASSFLAGLGVIPSDVLDGFAIDCGVVVSCGALPRTDGGGVAVVEEVDLDIVRWEVMIALDDDSFVAFCEDGTVESDLNHDF